MPAKSVARPVDVIGVKVGYINPSAIEPYLE